MLTLGDIKWASEECARQNSGELSVHWLCNALHYAREEMRSPASISGLNILILGSLVEPEKNKYGFRTTQVYFQDMTKQALVPHLISPAIERLVRQGDQLSAAEWYKEFQLIHPFLDGNGRVGSILYNLKRGTIGGPVVPPEMF